MENHFDLDVISHPNWQILEHWCVIVIGVTGELDPGIRGVAPTVSLAKPWATPLSERTLYHT